VQTVQLISRPGSTNTGIGRYAVELERGLCQRDVDLRVARLRTRVPKVLDAFAHRAGYDLKAFLSSYPLRVETFPADVTHITSQTLASLLLTQRLPKPVIVTVHDILPYLLRNDPKLQVYQNPIHRWMDLLAMRGLRRADRLIADSWFSRDCLINELRIPGDRIRVVHLGIDHAQFRPLDVPEEVRERYSLDPEQRYLIYVGSEDPRKNLRMLVESLAILRRDRNDVVLLKVGKAHFDDERTKLLEYAQHLGVRDVLRVLDDVPEADLPYLYNLADVCVMPSRYEGFGFPVLEAMACGTPVICSNRTSLPELAGDAALQFDPDHDGAALLAALIDRVLGDENVAESLRAKGMQRAQRFTWSALVEQMAEHYQATAMPRGSRVAPIRGHKWL
jgi:glycosyltransferase involved in cell wall biosynthesis